MIAVYSSHAYDSNQPRIREEEAFTLAVKLILFSNFIFFFSLSLFNVLQRKAGVLYRGCTKRNKIKLRHTAEASLMEIP